MDGRDRGEIEILHGGEHLVHRHEVLDQLLLGLAEQAEEHVDIRADHEPDLLAADEQQALDLGIRLEETDHLGQFGQGGIVELVDGFPLEVEAQLGYAPLEHGTLEGLAFKSHGQLLL